MLKRNSVFIILFLLMFFTSFAFLRVNASNFPNLNFNSEKLKMAQNNTISFPDWENCQNMNNLYIQDDKLLLTPFETTGDWTSNIYMFNTFYLYDIFTIASIPAYSTLDLTVYLQFEDTGFIPLSSPLNYTVMSEFNGNWSFYIYLYFTLGDWTPSIELLRFNIFSNISEEFPIPINTDTIIMLSHLIILFVFALSTCLIYTKLKNSILFTLIDAILIAICFVCFFDITQPFYPFLTIATLGLGVILMYKNIMYLNE